MDDFMRSLIEAPLADPARIYAPGGKRPAARGPKVEYDDIGCPKISSKEMAARKKRVANDKLEALYAYYATTDLTAEKIAEHMGLYRQEQTGVGEDKKPIFTRVLDVERVEKQLAWRRAA